jgi:hypothetical protein
VLYWNLNDRPLTLEENARLVDVVYLADGLNSTISVSRTDDYLALRTNGKVDASNHDVTTQLLVGHLGAMAHPAAPRPADRVWQRRVPFRRWPAIRKSAPRLRRDRTGGAEAPPSPADLAEPPCAR